MSAKPLTRSTKPNRNTIKLSPAVASVSHSTFIFLQQGRVLKEKKRISCTNATAADDDVVAAGSLHDTHLLSPKNLNNFSSIMSSTTPAMEMK